jgi:hypothetical protein
MTVSDWSADVQGSGQYAEAAQRDRADDAGGTAALENTALHNFTALGIVADC